VKGGRINNDIITVYVSGVIDGGTNSDDNDTLIINAENATDTLRADTGNNIWLINIETDDKTRHS